MQSTGTYLKWFIALAMVAALDFTAAAQFGGPPLPPPPLPPPSAWMPKLDFDLQARVASITGNSAIVVRASNAASVSAVATLVQSVGGTLGRSLSIIDGRAVVLPNASLATVASSALVAHLSLDRPVLGATDHTSETVGATAVREQLGYDGAGVGVAIIDSGITPSHDDLADSATGAERVDDFVDFINAAQTPYDDYGHGTHVAGIVAGNGFDSGGGRTGIAPAAHLVVLKAIDSTGHGRISDIIAAIDYVVSHKDAFNIRVLNLSVAAAVSESYNDDPFTLAAKRAVSAGIVVVAAAGNAGRDAQGQTQYGGIGAPGNAPWVLTVGASSHMGTADRSDDLMAAFSSRGPSAVDYGAKPDLVAPGVGIESLSNPNSAMYTSHSAYLLDGTVATPYLPYLSLSGTSMAAPVVAGTVALMLQANPALTPNAVKAILQYSSQPYDQYDALTQGAGFLNAKGAVTLAQYFAAPNAVYPSSDGWGTRLIWGNQLVQAGRLRGDVNAWAVDVVWGAATTASGQTIEWGVTCSTGDCDSTGAWQPWVASGSDDGQSHNVVWGSSCGGADCHRAWTTSDDEGVVWGTGDDSEGVVWGTNCADADSSCESVTWSNQ